jgi:hypothetical protein
MTKEKARVYTQYMNNVSALMVTYVVTSFSLGMLVVGIPPGWENLPLGVVAVAGLLSVLFCAHTTRSIIDWETRGDH